MTGKVFSTFLLVSIVLLNADCERKINSHFDVNFAHLQHLTQTICAGNDTFDIIHIYSNFPEYHWVDADKEGISCVDDVARACVLYLGFYEAEKDSTILPNIRRLINFLVKMQTEDGEFYNFLLGDTTINKGGRTSRKKFDFWAARGYWALGKAYSVFHTIDPQYANFLKEKFLLCKIPLGKILQKYPETIIEDNIPYPTWLINDYGADATAEFMLGANAFLRTQFDGELFNAVKKLAAGILLMQIPDNLPHAGAFLSWKGIWHDWGNSQMQALAEFSEISHDSSIIAALKKEAGFLAKMMIDGRIHEFAVKGKEKEFPQIAYGIRCQAAGLLRLAKITGEKKYAQLAGITASWLYGNNAARTQMYDPYSGRVYDGIDSANSINKNSGAESTIEGLMTLLEINRNKDALEFFFCKKIKTDYKSKFKAQIVLENGNNYELAFDGEDSFVIKPIDK